MNKILLFVFVTAIAVAAVFLFEINDKDELMSQKSVRDSSGDNKTLGQTKKVMVGNVLFDLPELSEQKNLTYDDPPSETLVLTLYFTFPQYLKTTIPPDYTAAHKVRVELRYMGRVVKPKQGLDAETGKWKSVIPNPQLELTEYRAKNLTGGWGSISFQPIDKTYLTPAGDPLIFLCQGQPPPNVESCSASVQYPNGIHAWINIPYQIFPHWKQIYSHINEQIKAFMME